MDTEITFHQNLDKSLENLKVITQLPPQPDSKIDDLIAASSFGIEEISLKQKNEFDALKDIEDQSEPPEVFTGSEASTAQQIGTILDSELDAPTGFLGLKEENFKIPGSDNMVNLQPSLEDYGKKKNKERGGSQFSYNASGRPFAPGRDTGYTLQYSKGDKSQRKSWFQNNGPEITVSLEQLTEETIKDFEEFVKARNFDPTRDMPTAAKKDDQQDLIRYEREKEKYEKKKQEWKKEIDEPSFDTDVLIPAILVQPLLKEVLQNQKEILMALQETHNNQNELKKSMSQVKSSMTTLVANFHSLRSQVTDQLAVMRSQKVVTTRQDSRTSPSSPVTEWHDPSYKAKGTHGSNIQGTTSNLKDTNPQDFGLPARNITGNKMKLIRRVKGGGFEPDKVTEILDRIRKATSEKELEQIQGML